MSILFLLPDGPSVFKSSAQPKKDIAISHEIELDRLKRISKYFSCTINDVVTAIHTGVLQRLNVATESKKKLKKVRVTVPANLRDGEDMNEVANAFGHYFLELPIDEEMTANRLKISQKRMRQLKQSSHPLVIYDVLSLLGKAPQLIQKLTLKLSANGTTAVMSNVVGPRKKIVLADYSVSSLAFVVPHGEMAMGLSALSYEKGVRLAIAINAGQIQGLDYFSDMVESEISILEELLDSPLYKSRVKMSEIA